MNMPDEYVEQYVCTVTAYNSLAGDQREIDIYLTNPITHYGSAERQWKYIAKSTLVSNYIYITTDEYADVTKYNTKVSLLGRDYFNADGLNDEYIPEF